jgi:phosphoribosyl-ATP pyrophosphohydrolase
LLYHFLVLLEFKKISIPSIMKELKRRQRISGIQEKKNRKKNVR